MPNINLIQEQRNAIRRDERRARLALVAFLASGVSTALGYGFLIYRQESLRAEEARLRADIAKMAPLLGQIERNRQAVASLSPRLDTLRSAQGASDRWARVLAHISVQTPSTVWLTRMRSDQTDLEKPVAITFGGVASRQEPVGEFLLRLQNARDLENVALKYTQEKAGANKERLVEFELGADLAGTAQPKPKKLADGEANQT